MNALLVAALLAPAAEPDNPVLAAAKKRQEAIKSIEFVLKVTEVTEPGGGSTTPAVRPKPPERTTISWTARILFDGSRSRVEDDRVPDTAGGNWRQVHACDGVLVRWLQWPPGRETFQNHSGDLYAAPDRHECPALELAPPFLTCRPVGLPGWSSWFDFNGATSKGDALEIDGTRCNEWFLPVFKGSDLRQCWVDPSAEYLVRRFQRKTYRDEGITRTDVKYAKDEASGVWLPSEWECKQFGRGEVLRKTYRVAVDKLLVNASLSDDEFELPFPPGIGVYDHRDETDYLVQPDGTLSKLRRGTGSIAPPPAPPSGSWFTQPGPWIIGVVCVVVVVGWLVARRVLRKRPTPSG